MANIEEDTIKAMLQALEHMLDQVDRLSVVAGQFVTAQKTGKPLGPAVLASYGNNWRRWDSSERRCATSSLAGGRSLDRARRSEAYNRSVGRVVARTDAPNPVTVYTGEQGCAIVARLLPVSFTEAAMSQTERHDQLPSTGLVAAIYARKSTGQSSVADEAKSVRRQIDQARAYAIRKGWIINEAHVYVDDGISGAEFAKRAGFVRLMTALSPTPPFQVLVMSEESRLGRESIETAYALKQVVTAGVRVFFYLEDRERTLDSPMEKVMLALQTMADEMEREKARQRMVDTMARKARAGHVTGGKCFGYENVEIRGANGERSHVEQRIKDDEAAVIRRIFELAASGYGQIQIGKVLNAEGARPPRSQQGRPSAWGPSSVHEALFRPRYRGELVWNKTKKRDRWGQHRVTDRTSDEWVRVPAEHLRIVSEELWQAAHARTAAARAACHLKSGPPASKHLLPGFARCAWCNGGLYARKRTRTGRESEWFYACTSHHQRGHAVCRNVVQVAVPDVDRAVLGSIRDILTPDLVDEIIAKAREMHAPDY
jgi:site-specific DNA recombinase